jgi:hypothetical protein
MSARRKDVPVVTRVSAHDPWKSERDKIMRNPGKTYVVHSEKFNASTWSGKRGAQERMQRVNVNIRQYFPGWLGFSVIQRTNNRTGTCEVFVGYNL